MRRATLLDAAKLGRQTTVHGGAHSGAIDGGELGLGFRVERNPVRERESKGRERAEREVNGGG